MALRIRRAQQQDMSDVERIINSMQVSRELADWDKKKWGFFEYPKQWAELINAQNPYFVVTDNRKRVNGFLLAYSHEFFKLQYANVTRPDWRFVLDNFDEDEFLYIDMLGVENPESLGAGRVVKRLYDRAVVPSTSAGFSRALSYVCEKPWHNERLANLFRKWGFNRITGVKIQAADEESSEKIKFGLYEKHLRKPNHLKIKEN